MKTKLTVITLAAAAGAIIFFAFGYRTAYEENPPDLKDASLVVSTFADGLKGPRVVAFDPAGNMIVSQTSNGDVVLLRDANNDGQADDKKVILKNLNKPHGLAFYNDGGKDYLYVAETDKVTRYLYNPVELSVSGAGEDIASLPAGGRHFTRTIAFGPSLRSIPVVQGGLDLSSKSRLYVSVGSSCDVCVEDTWKRAALLESDTEGVYIAEFAGGLRNAVFFTFHPETGEIWATEMGRDNLGDNLPPDEINIIKAPDSEDEFGAKRYGWPFCYGQQVRDDKFNPSKVDRRDIFQDCSRTEPPVIEIPAHSAPLGLAFIGSDKWPKEWQGNLLVAYHGSWNRSEKTGYKVVKFALGKDNKVTGQEDLINWLEDGKVSGRPVDLKFGPDGALYISDDYTGRIYRVTVQ